MRALSPAEAAALVRARDELAVPLGPGIPSTFLHALGERDDFEALSVFGALLIDFFTLFTKPGVRLCSGFFGPVERMLAAADHAVEFLPADFRRFASAAAHRAPRVMATNATFPDDAGRVSLALHAGATLEEMQRCARDPDRVLVVELNRTLPRTFGLPPEHPHSLALDEIDVVIESDRDAFVLPDTEPTEVERAIAAHVGSFIEDGATLQTGIGGIPNAVTSLLSQESGGDYGIHSEMFTTGLMQLHLAGKVTNRKGHPDAGYDGHSICTFAAGTRELYDWLDGNEAVRFLPVEHVNAERAIARNRNFVSINGALAVDFDGQIAADTLGPRQYSGIGGHEDFVAGAAFSTHGRSLVCLPSTTSVDGELVSRIVPRFAAGTCVTTPRHQVDVVVTEYGAAELAGRSVRERAEDLLAISHPELRDGLEKALREG